MRRYYSSVRMCHYIEFDTAVTLKNVIFWDVAPCKSRVNRHLQPPAHAGSSLADFSTLKMEAISSSETSVHTRSARRQIPEDDILDDLRSALLDKLIIT
jgi:hypothetical protein